MNGEKKHALSAYEMRELRGLGWQDHGPTLPNSPPGDLDDLYWRPCEVLVWIVTRDEQAIRGFNGYVEKLMQRIVYPHDSQLDRGDIEKSVHFGELNRDTAGHHRDCPRTVFEGVCDCASRSRLRYCRCDAATSTVGRCTCVNDGLKALFRVVEDGLPLFGKRDAEDEFRLVAPTARPRVQLVYGKHGLQLLPNFQEVALAKAHVLDRWPADAPDRRASVSPPTTDAEAAMLVDPPGYEEALMIFIERLHRGATKQVRLEEVSFIEQRLGPKLDRDSITKELRPFFRLVVWDKGRVSNAQSVVQEIDAYLDRRRLVRRKAAANRAGRAGQTG